MEAITFELIDRIQDILSIPIAIWICYMLWKIRQAQKPEQIPFDWAGLFNKIKRRLKQLYQNSGMK